MTKHAEKATSKQSEERSKVSPFCTTLSTLQHYNTNITQREGTTAGWKKAFSCFCGSDNGAGWANKGAALYLRGYSPSLNKHQVSACSMFITCLCYSDLSQFSHYTDILFYILMIMLNSYFISPVCCFLMYHLYKQAYEAGRRPERLLSSLLQAKPSQVSSCVSFRICHAGTACWTNHCHTTQRLTLFRGGNKEIRPCRTGGTIN